MNQHARQHYRQSSEWQSEREYAAESAVDVAHKGCRKVAGRSLKVSLVQGDQGGDVDDRVCGQAGGDCGQEDIAWHGGQRSVRRDDGCNGGVQPAGVEGVGLDHQDGRRLAGLLPCASPRSAQQICWVSECEASITIAEAPRTPDSNLHFSAAGSVKLEGLPVPVAAHAGSRKRRNLIHLGGELKQG
jgi:hypothetical protein